MSLPENWDQRLAKLTRGCTEEEKGEIYHRLLVSFAWYNMLDLKQRGKLTSEATAKFMRSMEEEDARRKEEKIALRKNLKSFKNNALELGQHVDSWSEEVLKQSGI